MRRLILAREPVVVDPLLTPMEKFTEDCDVADFLVDYYDWDWDERYFDTPPLRVPLLDAAILGS